MPGAVTIATNMAGRGTDIQLGGNLDMRLKDELAGIADEQQRRRGRDDPQPKIADAQEGSARRPAVFL